jgi:hypothetical protein
MIQKMILLKKKAILSLFDALERTPKLSIFMRSAMIISENAKRTLIPSAAKIFPQIFAS